MLGSSRLMAFLGATDLDRASKFYGDVLGLSLVRREGGGAAVFNANGTMLRVSKVREVAKALYTVLGWSVPDIKAAIGQLEKRGVAFERFGGFPQDDLGIWTAPDGTQVAWFKDPDGNILSVTQFRG